MQKLMPNKRAHRIQFIAFLIFICVFILNPSFSQEKRSWRVEFFPGVAYNIPSTLKICQQGYSDLKFTAKYYTEPFKSPVYGMIRIGTWKGNYGIEAELIHHKLYIKNPPAEITNFSITHGYNLLSLNYGRILKKEFYLRAGVGFVLAHAESIVRGMMMDEHNGFLKTGYYITGPYLMTGIQKRIRIWKPFYFSVEGKFSAAYAKVPVVNGYAEVPNFAFHGLFGLGADIR